MSRSALLEGHGVEGAAFSSKLSFEVGAHDLAVARGLGALEGVSFEEIRVSRGVFLVPGPEVVVVGDEAEFPVGLEHAMERPHRGVLHDSPLVMPRLGPRITEVEVHDPTARIRKPVRDDLGGVVVKQPHVRDRAAADAIRRVAEELARPFDAEEVGLRLKSGLLDEERPLAGTDLELERPLGVREERPRIPDPGLERREIVTHEPVAVELLLAPSTESERHHEPPPEFAMRAGCSRIQSAMSDIARSSMVRSMAPYSSMPPVVAG